MSPDRDPLPEMLQRLHARATWDDLVMPEAVTRQLRAIAQQARPRKRATERSSKPASPAALFPGPPGTGKAMAAEVLATALHFDLFRVDLTAVVRKCIGDTEKNLRRLFDAVNAPDVILLFDEADALLGSRSDVKDSHDRYANLEVAYLLQRLEQSAGLAILTNNSRGTPDPAFLRRVHFVVDFPLPDHACRERIWRRVFPADADIEQLDYRRLARLEITGGTIRDIATRAALRAAAQATSIRSSKPPPLSCESLAEHSTLRTHSPTRTSPSPRILPVTRATHVEAARAPSRRHVAVAASHLDIDACGRSVAVTATVNGESGRRSMCTATTTSSRGTAPKARTNHAFPCDRVSASPAEAPEHPLLSGPYGHAARSTRPARGLHHA